MAYLQVHLLRVLWGALFLELSAINWDVKNLCNYPWLLCLLLLLLWVYCPHFHSFVNLQIMDAYTAIANLRNAVFFAKKKLFLAFFVFHCLFVCVFFSFFFFFLLGLGYWHPLHLHFLDFVKDCQLAVNWLDLCCFWYVFFCLVLCHFKQNTHTYTHTHTQNKKKWLVAVLHRFKFLCCLH